MALERIDLQEDGEPLPESVEEFVVEAEKRINDYLDGGGRNETPGFIPSDPRQAYRALRTVIRERLATGDRLCEWGSGFGVVASLASLLGLEACGIEIEADLVDAAEELAADFDLPVEFAWGTFIPPGGEEFLDQAGKEFDWLSAGGACGHDALGLDPVDFNIVFAYPWPGEEEVVTGLFDRYAADGALLITFDGREHVRVRRKVTDWVPDETADI